MNCILALRNESDTIRYCLVLIIRASVHVHHVSAYRSVGTVSAEILADEALYRNVGNLFQPQLVCDPLHPVCIHIVETCPIHNDIVCFVQQIQQLYQNFVETVIMTELLQLFLQTATTCGLYNRRRGWQVNFLQLRSLISS